jgi:hypothetical protein
MKWLQDNPLGMILAAISGVFVLLALGMAIVGTLPVSVETAGAETEITSDNQTNMTARQIGILADYQIVNEKPVFNESRNPVIDDEEPTDEELPGEIEVKDAPDVRLTGVVITPGMKIASLTPADGNLETVMAHEGDSLTGEFVGWQVAAVNPRTVVLESRDGQSLELDLQVHDAKIQEPVKPVSAAPIPAALSNAQALAGQSSETTGDDEPLSRAEQIRQRIAERRAELRQEQEAQQSQNAAQAGSAGSKNKTKDYQTAIREMMKNKSKDQGGNDKKDG